MQDLYQGFNSHCQCDCSYSHLTVGHFSVNGKLADIVGLLNPTSLSRIWGMAKFPGGMRQQQDYGLRLVQTKL